MKFTNKVVWITGASSGIGEHLCYAFSEQGAQVIISSRNEKELIRVKNNSPHSEQVMILPLDVTQPDQIEKATQAVFQKFDFLNILINNAGISQRSYVTETELAVYEKIMAVNFLGPVALTKAVLPYFQKQQYGQIVAISSVVGKIGTPLRSGYAASKHAIHGFFDSLRAEVHQDNIKVTLICPGYVHTNISINALRGDGSKFNIMGEKTQNGISPAAFAQKALRAIGQQKDEVYIGGREIYGIYLKRFFPAMVNRLVRKINVV